MLVSVKLQMEASARHNGEKILHERFHQELAAIVLWRQSSGALQSVMVSAVRIQRPKAGICMRCASNGVLFKHAFL